MPKKTTKHRIRKKAMLVLNHRPLSISKQSICNKDMKWKMETTKVENNMILLI